MIRSTVISFVLFFLLFVVVVDAQSASGTISGDAVSNFRPSLAVVIGILCVMFALTFFLLVYAKFCHSEATVHADQRRGMLRRTLSRFSGIDKKVVESLPFFRFSSLKGSRQGLECSVCLSKFEDIEILRLLPQCKHGFHIDCIDQWLEKHSSCPLCRLKVNVDDPTIFTYSNSMRFSRIQSEPRDDSNIEVFVQREQETHGSISSRFSIGSSFRKNEKGDIESETLIQDDDGFHRLNHKIIVSDVVLKNRWSSVSSSDLMLLNSKMLNDMSSDRFSKTRTIEDEQTTNKPSTSDSEATSSRASSRIVDQTERRSMSEIIALSRFRDVGTRNGTSESSLSKTYTKEERTRRIWLPIARRTVQWFANRERPQQSKGPTQHLDV